MVCYVYWWLHTSELGILTKRKFWSGKGFQKFLHHGIDTIHGINTISRKKIQVLEVIIEKNNSIKFWDKISWKNEWGIKVLAMTLLNKIR